EDEQLRPIEQFDLLFFLDEPMYRDVRVQIEGGDQLLQSLPCRPVASNIQPDIVALVAKPSDDANETVVALTLRQPTDHDESPRFGFDRRASIPFVLHAVWNDGNPFFGHTVLH